MEKEFEDRLREIIREEVPALVRPIVREELAPVLEFVGQVVPVILEDLAEVKLVVREHQRLHDLDAV